MGAELADLQERLWAERTAGSERRVLLVLQGMDTSGKGGVLRHTVGLVDPQGVRITSFKAPTEEERAHDFLWRIEQRPPAGGLSSASSTARTTRTCSIARVRALAAARGDRAPLRRDQRVRGPARRRGLLDHQVHAAHQRRRSRRSASPSGSTTPRSTGSTTPATSTSARCWPDYREAYEIALERTNTDVAPWHVVPSDKKWFRNLAVGQLLLDTLRGLDLAVAEGRLRRRGREGAARRGGPGPVTQPRTPARPVTRYVTPLREGGSLPGVVEGDDLGTYVCKFRGAGQGAKVLVAEVVVSGLADPARPAHPAPRRARPRPRARPLRGRRGGAGPAQRERRAQPRHRLPPRRRSGSTGR